MHPIFPVPCFYNRYCNLRIIWNYTSYDVSLIFSNFWNINCFNPDQVIESISIIFELIIRFLYSLKTFSIYQIDGLIFPFSIRALFWICCLLILDITSTLSLTCENTSVFFHCCWESDLITSWLTISWLLDNGTSLLSTLFNFIGVQYLGGYLCFFLINERV